jgi:hypothetical protein
VIKTLVSLTLANFAFVGGPCSTLTVTGTGAGGTELRFDLDGAAPDAPAVLVIGPTTGSFTIRFGPIGSLELGIVPPFAPLPMGITDGNGDVRLTIRVPDNLPGFDLNAQGFSIDFTVRPPTLEFCTSNVAPFHIGGS